MIEPVPPVAPKVIEPVPVEHSGFVPLAVRLIIEGWLIVSLTPTLEVHPLASVITAVYVPADKLEILKVVSPVDHKIVYGAVPPFAIAEAEPLLPPKQVTFIIEEE